MGRHLFDEVIGPNGILRHKTRILVTHRASVLTNVDQIIVLKEGSISESGTFEELIARKGDFAEFVAQYIQESDSELPEEEVEIVEQLKQQVRPLIERSISKVSEKSGESNVRRRQSMRTSSISSTQADRDGDKGKKNIQTNEEQGRLIEAESAERGSVKYQVYKHYFQMIGYTLIALVLLSFLLSNSATILSGLWLSEWSNDALDPNKRNDTSLRDLRLGVYGGIGLFESVFSLSANLLISLSCIRAAKLLHNTMLERILRAPMSFFGKFFS